MARILLIDDDTTFRNMLRLTLEHMGHQVTEAGDGKAGLAAHLAAPADLVLTDLVMPKMEGVETIMELKRRSPTLKIIAMSGGGRGNATDYLSTARQLGASRTLAKPFSSEELSTVIAEVLQTA